MSTVQDVLRAAIEERINRSRLILIDIEAAVLRIQGYQELADKNSKELEELLDALEFEIDHYRRVHSS